MGIKKYSLTRDQVRELCPSCADKMQLARIKELKLSADELGNLLPADESAIKLFTGFSQGLCDKFGADAGFFTRCAEHMAGKVEDENGFCASLKKFCTGHWPAEISKEHEQVEEFGAPDGNQNAVGPHNMHGGGQFKVGGRTFEIGSHETHYNRSGYNESKYTPGKVLHFPIAGTNQYVRGEVVSAKNSDYKLRNASGKHIPMPQTEITYKVLGPSDKVKEHAADADYQEYIDKRVDVSPDAAKYDSGDLDVIKGHIVTAWKKTIDKAGPPSAQEQKNNAVAGMKSMTRQEVSAKCPDCAGKMAGNEQDMPVDNGGHMQHICGKGGRAIANMSEEDEVHAFEVAEYANNIKGVEIFRTGTHNGDQYTTQDLDDMVTAFGVLDYRPAIKIGHSKDQPGAPAYGWVQNVTRDGDKLRADFTDMHDSVVEAIRNKSYDRCSAEIYFNLKRGGKDYRRALKAVALLGAEVPAVAGLTPLHKMEFAAEGFEKVGAFEQELNIPSQALVDALAERVSGLVNLIKEHDMSKNAGKITELKERVDELNEQIVTLNAAGKHTVKAVGDKYHLMDPMGKKMSEHPTMAAANAAKKDAEDAADQGADETTENAIKELTQQASALEQEIHALEIEEDTTGAIADLSQQLAESKAREEAANKQTKELSERVARIESERRNAEVGAKVEACKIPAFRNSLSAVYSYALAHSGEVVKIYSTDKDGKTVTVDKTLVEAIDGVVTEINAQSEKLFKALAFTGQTVRSDGVVEEDAGVEVQKKVTEYRLKHPEVKTYEQAMVAVLKAEPDLGQRYRDQLGQEQ